MTDHVFDATSDVAPLDTERILVTLAEHDVRYVLIGGLAAIVHGSTLATSDADVVPASDDENLDRLLEALASLDARVLATPKRLDIESGELWETTALRRGGVGLRDAGAWHFSTSAGAIDVVLSAAAVGTYDAHLPAATRREVFGVTVEVVGVEDLIRSKQELGRPKDLHVIHELRNHEP